MNLLPNLRRANRPSTLLLSIACLTAPVLAQTVTSGIQPSYPRLSYGQTQQFTLPGYNDVTWSVRPAGTGTISPTGLYTAPASGSIAFIYAQPAGGAPFYTLVFLLPAPPTNTTGSQGGTQSGNTGTTTLSFLNGTSTGNAPIPVTMPPGPGWSTQSPTSGSAGGSGTTSVSVSIAPSTAYVQAGQSVSVTALVSGSQNQQVQWSLQPDVGTINNGVYTAPSFVASDTQVTVTATSVADPTQTATATVLVGPAISPVSPVSPAPVSNVAISVGPSSATLTAGQTAQFAASVQGSTNTAVIWSLTPNIGSVSNGIYTAPSTISTQESVLLTATSAADPSETASVAIVLKPSGNVTQPAIIGISVSPSTASLSAGQRATFTASVSGTSNTAVTWSMNPPVGAILNGVYTAPASITTSQSVTITATSVAESSKSASATVTLNSSKNAQPPNPPATNPSTTLSAGTVTMPLEVIGANGTTVSATVNVPNGSNLNGPLSLYMQIHGLRFETQASVKVNNSGWMAISDSTVTLLGNATAYGGIGGGFATLKMTMALPAGSVNPGANTVTFQFNRTDGRVSGFRVLAFNFETADGTMLLPSSTFVNDNPSTWQPPSTDASDIATGQTLWHTAPLVQPLVGGGSKPILAHCSDCHAQDGRDLKYFNYSNKSIEARAVFHGLTPQQGAQIASYIRSLNVPNPGRPWNPPYQPGPGLDSQPIENWAAGAGLDAVVDNDQEMLNAMFPSGFQASMFAPTTMLDQREIPLPFQLPDWNQWLPGTHPMDAFGSTFTTSAYFKAYQTLSSTLQPQNASVYVAQYQNFAAWFSGLGTLENQVAGPVWASQNWTPEVTDEIYSIPQWGMVKTWELLNGNQLEAYSQNVFGPQADPRGWHSSFPFFAAPHELKMNGNGTPGLRNGTAQEYAYLTNAWYTLQLILNDGNGKQDYQIPIDWGYVYGFVKSMGDMVSPQAGIETLWMLKGLETTQQQGLGPQVAGNGWQSFVVEPWLLVTEEFNDSVWMGVDPSTRVALATGIVTGWLSQVNQFTPQQFYAGGWTTANATPVAGGSPYDGVFIDEIWYLIPRLSFIGVNHTLVDQLAAWAHTMWPHANWTADANATCSWANNAPNYYISCSE